MKNEHKKTPKPGFGVFLFALFAEQHTVALDIELLEQIADGEVLLFLTADINDNVTGIHHNQTVAVLDGILHVMRYHQCGEIVACDDLFGDLQHLICGFRIERCGMPSSSSRSGR